MTYQILTYGCQMNESDSERIAAYLKSKNYKLADSLESANLVIINMCSVRQSAVDRVYHKILNLKSKILNLHLKTKILLTGCVLEKDKEKFEKLGIKFRNFDLENINPVKFAPQLFNRVKPRTGFVPIMQGCNNFCTYCVVPYTRGREKCRSPQEIICEVKHLIKRGVKEITLLGQNVNSYKLKIKNEKLKISIKNSKLSNKKIIDFADLLKEINALAGDFKIRFLTNHPKDISDKLLDTVAQCDKVEKYLHLPVQSGDNEILKKMNRGYTREQYLTLVKKIKKKIPDVKLTTDIIVGFPGETKKQFRRTLDLVRKVGFKTAYIAMYSPRPGTAAYKLKDDAPIEEKKRRHRLLLDSVRSPARRG